MRAPGSIESIERVALSARDIDAIAQVEKIDDGRQLAASAFTDGVSAVRIAIVARADRAAANLKHRLNL